MNNNNGWDFATFGKVIWGLCRIAFTLAAVGSVLYLTFDTIDKVRETHKIVKELKEKK